MSLIYVFTACNDTSLSMDRWLSRLESSNWISHVKDTLNCACIVAQCLEEIFDFVLLSRYQKTESVIKTTAEKTTSILGGLGSGLTSKIGALKNSESFRSFEDKIGSAYENVKGSLTTLCDQSSRNS
ncbi:hypothetical protein J6590_056454 [Homalodisca vitripennis]|nr:hypothetical protein J6590_056454 [Homalodisca vitripennis]